MFVTHRESSLGVDDSEGVVTLGDCRAWDGGVV
jgi:hypothetical protein